ncbi:MAG: patatin-like phospholipase family protein [Myxococcota bacterium]
MIPTLAFLLLAQAQVDHETFLKDTQFNVAITVSGGVSLGMYMAGLQYGALQFSQHAPRPTRFLLATGTSAGSANALIAALTSCRSLSGDPRESLAYRVWADGDHRGLFKYDQVSAVGAFSRDVLDDSAALIREVFLEGLPENCDVVLGATATRVIPYSVDVAEGFAIPRQEEKFAIRLQGRGVGRVPRLSNYVDPYSPVPQPMLPFVSDTEDDAELAKNFDHVRDLIFASMAFPLAFAPKELRHCMTVPSGSDNTPGDTRCDGERIVTDLFVDGGIFDNFPLRLAFDRANLGLIPVGPGHLGWRDLDRPRPNGIADGYAGHVNYVYIDPRRKAVPPKPVKAGEMMKKIGQEQNVFGLLEELAGSIVTSAQAKELYTLVEQTAALREGMRLTSVHFPHASGYLGAFLGFFDDDFRHYDFYLGMYDAMKFFQTHYTASADVKPETFMPEGVARQLEERGEVAPGWEPFTCLVSWYEKSYTHWQSTCKGTSQDFRILLQVGIDLTHDHCSTLESAEQVSTSHPFCYAASKGAARPEVSGVTQLSGESYQVREGESAFEHAMRLFESYGYEFDALGLTREKSSKARVKVRRKLLGMIEAVADKQQGAERVVFLTAGRQFVNNIAYEPPKNWAYFVAGTHVEIGASLLPFEWDESWARFNLALQTSDIFDLLTLDPQSYTFSVAAGPELEMLWWTTPQTQPMMGFRGGYQFGNVDDFGGRACTEADAFSDARNCSQWFVQPYAALALLEILRIQLTATIFPDAEDFGQPSWQLDGGFGLQFF